MQEHIDALVNYIQGNCLWQFFSRTWDREENISGILSKTEALLAGSTPAIATDLDRCHLADAKMLSAEFRSNFPWITTMDKDRLHAVFQAVTERMREIAIVKSRNGELNIQYY